MQYGPRIKAAVVHLTYHHRMPVAHTGTLGGDFFGLPMSDAMVLAFGREVRTLLGPTGEAIGEAIKATPIGNIDETGMRVAGKLHWLHVLATTSLTWIGGHTNRGKKAFDAFGIWSAFIGTLIHDGWQLYRDLDCRHSLVQCPPPARADLYVFEEVGQVWASRMSDLLVAAGHAVKVAGQPLAKDRIAHYRSAYAEILAAGETANPRAPPSGKRGKTRQSKALNLIDCLRIYADDVWRFMTDQDVPFTNNIAEQAVCMPKVKQKISGGFRTAVGLDIFCTIRS